MRNLMKKYGYTGQGAKEICIYVIDNRLAKTFASTNSLKGGHAD